MVSCRRDDELAPEVFVVMFVSRSDVPNFVTVEALLELVGVRLGIKLVPVFFGLRLPLALFTFTFFAFAIFAFSSFTLDHRDIHWHNIILTASPGNGRHLSSHLIEGVESTRMESQVVSDRSVLDASLEHSLPHIIRHGLTRESA